MTDTFQGEHATVYHVKDRGLVVITSCGHAGVINSVRQAQKASGVDRVNTIIAVHAAMPKKLVMPSTGTRERTAGTGRRGEARTRDLGLVRAALSRLSYPPVA